MTKDRFGNEIKVDDFVLVLKDSLASGDWTPGEVNTGKVLQLNVAYGPDGKEGGVLVEFYANDGNRFAYSPKQLGVVRLDPSFAAARQD